MSEDASESIDIFVTRALPGRAIPLLKGSRFSVQVHPGEFGPGREEFLARAAPCLGLLTLLTDRIDEALLDACPRLKAVSNYAVGYDNVDVAACTRRGVAVTNTPGVLTDATAELTLALLFAAARRIAEGDRIVRAGRFQGWSPSLCLGTDIHGKTLGLVGAGRIGRAVGRRAAALGMHLLYAERNPVPEFERETAAQHLPLDELLRRSDFVSIHVPLTEETRRLIGRRELALMKPQSILLNTARGPIVDEKALAEALSSGRLRAAGLDVYEDEPDVDPALLELDNVVLLPHVGSATEETRDAMGLLAATNLLDALEGRRPKHLVNPEVLGG